jgi:low temperature requirement protein LtrA
MSHGHAPRPRPWRRPMGARDPAEAPRVATPLELLFDLCVVVAVAQAAAALHHGLAHGHLAAIPGFGMAFCAVWWAWMNFTWFASAYDTDDVVYRLLVLVQIGGVLAIAAGVPRAANLAEFDVVTTGYVIMRIGLVGLWLRAAAGDPAGRTTALRYAAGIALCQVVWIGMLWLPPSARSWLFLVAMTFEILVPMWAERARFTPWHPHHIQERYGLLTLIVLGESVLASTLAIQAAIDGGGLDAGLAGVIAGGLVTLFAMWWIYFDCTPDVRAGSSFVWGYGHYVVFASAAATGAGIAVLVDFHTGAAHLAAWQAGLAATVPIAVYVLAVWLVVVRQAAAGGELALAYPLAAVLIAGAAFTPAPLPIAGALLVVLTAARHVAAHRREPR